MRISLLGAMIAAAATGASAQTAPVTPAQPVGLTFTTGVDHSSGDYGLADKTKITVVPFAARLTVSNFALTASVPYIRLNTPGGVGIGPDGKPLPGVPTAAGTRKGLGDVSLGAKYNIPGDRLGGLEVGLGGRVKLPTAKSSKGLSTGKTDYAASVDVTYPIGTAAPFVEVGYRWLGDPDGFELRDGMTVSAGSSFQLPKGAVLIASYDYARSPTAATSDSQELFAGIAMPAGRLTFTGYGTKGLSNGSPDFGVGLLLTAKVL